MLRFRSLATSALLSFVASSSHGVDELAAPQAASQPPLPPLQDLIGSWKGVGQVRRGSSQGAWFENGDWAWKYSAGEAAVVFATPDGKHLRGGRITTEQDEGSLVLTAQASDDTEFSYVGRRDDDGAWRFVAVDHKLASSQPSRITLRLTAEGKRLVVLLERRTGPGDDAFAMLAEIGYTRVGSNFGQGSGGPKCIVTGGAGTIAVSHAGKTYYVCCSGCKELFDSEPEKVIADYQARLNK